jgi:hypothetical protein
VTLAIVRFWRYTASILTPAHRGRGFCFQGLIIANALTVPAQEVGASSLFDDLSQHLVPVRHRLKALDDEADSRVMSRAGLISLILVLGIGAGCGGAGGERTPQLLGRSPASEMGYGVGRSLTRATDNDPATIDSFGFWSLSRLGSGGIEFEDVHEKAKASIPYILEPDRARQGPGNWYQIDLHAKVLFGAGTGRAYLFASHNGYASALIEYEANTAGDGSIVRKASSYIDGSSKETLRSNDDELRFRNYLQYKAVQPGLNQLTFAVEVHGSLEVKKAEILPDSGIEYTRLGPARLTLGLHLPRELLRKGQRAILTVDVRNVGDRRVNDVRVSLEYARDDLRNTGPATTRLGDLVAKARSRTSFQVIPLHRGRILIGVQVGGRGGNSPGVSKTLNVH